MLRTDLACEFTTTKAEKVGRGIKRVSVSLNKEDAVKLNKPQGNYVSFESYAIVKMQKHLYCALSREIAVTIKQLCNKKNVLAVGLGNPNLTADSLGISVIRRLQATRLISGNEGLSLITPYVSGITGIESFDVVKAVSSEIHADAVIVIDSLAAARAGRIATVFQVTDVGITPGSGVSNHRKAINFDSLGIPVISIGVPLVIYASTIIEESLDSNYVGKLDDMIVTPKDIDVYVNDCADVIATAINKTFLV